MSRTQRAYLIGYTCGLEVVEMLAMSDLGRARRAAGMSQEVLAQRARTSRTALSAYENGRKSPTLSTAERLLAEAGFELTIRPRVTFHSAPGVRGRTYMVADRLPQLPVEQALATVVLPLRLNWSDPGRTFHMADRGDRARVYEAVLREGNGHDIGTYIDGALLADLWPELVLPRDLHVAWSPLIDRITGA